MLPIPDFYDPRNASRWSYRPNPSLLLQDAEEWTRRFGLRPQGEDEKRIHLLLVDLQRDFCHPEGALYVGGRSGRGAIEDSDRVARFIYAKLDRISEITTTLDTHFAFQIFAPAFWVTRDGNHPAPHRLITAGDVERGDLRPSPRAVALCAGGDEAWLTAYAIHYCKQLEKGGKYDLYLWPYHCLLGSDGHALVGVVHEARLFHSFARGSQSEHEIKGDSPFTENYSVFSPEVLVTQDGKKIGRRNVDLLRKLLASDLLLIAGQAASHCVKNTLEDLLDYIRQHDARLAAKVCILTDCMSAVAVPDGKGGFAADFTDEARHALERFASAGMQLVRSTEPVDSWLAKAGGRR